MGKLGSAWQGKCRGALVSVVLLVAAACGGDDGGSTTSTAADDPAATATTTADAATSEPATSEPDTVEVPSSDGPDDAVRGGDLTVLVTSETASMDPVTSTGSSGTQGPRFAAVYGGLVTYLAEDAAASPWMAAALDHNDDFTVWTLTLHEGMVFSDSSPFDAEAVRVNWARAQDPANRSPSYDFATAITSMEVTDPVTLVATLAAPDAHFDTGLSRRALNYIASPTAIAAGALVNEPVGAGPFVMTDWLRDDRMEFERNPAYFDAPRPNLDSLTMRIVVDERQRIDTFTTGDAEAFYSNVPDSLTEGAEAVGGEVWSIDLPDSIVLMPNNAAAPFDDARVRRVLALAIDREALAEAASPGSTAAESFTLAGTPWDTPDAALPEHDLAEAQRLVDEVVAEHGGPIEISMIGAQTNVELSEFVQAALNQLDGVNVSVETLDSPTFIGRVRSRDYQLVGWGLPWLDPDVSMGTFVESGTSTNYSGFADAEVDGWVRSSRLTADLDERAALYHQVFATLAGELPVVPMYHGQFGWATTGDVQGFAMYEDGVPRWDQIWLAS